MFIKLFSYISAFQSSLINLFLPEVHVDSLVLSCRHCVILPLILGCGICICICCEGPNLLYFPYENPTDPATVIKKTVFSSLFCSLLCPYMWRSFFFTLFSFVFYPAQCQYYILFITVPLKWTLISSRSNTLKFFSSTLLHYSWPLVFQ